MSERTILIADDSPIVLKAMEFRIKSAGYQVITAIDPSDAMAKVRTHQPDVIIMDINFPPDVGFGGGGAWDGFRILEWMKLNHSMGDAIQFIITGEDLEKHREKANAAGVKGLFHKPVDTKALLAKVEECLGEPTPAS
jgi:CheY-like chemotaxis protein